MVFDDVYFLMAFWGLAIHSMNNAARLPPSVHRPESCRHHYQVAMSDCTDNGQALCNH